MIAVTLAQWQELREFADRLANDALRFAGSGDPDWEAVLRNTISEYDARYGRG